MTVIEKQNDSLEHYGVKGMRWGVRKSDKIKKSLLKAGKKGRATVSKTIAIAKKKVQEYEERKPDYEVVQSRRKDYTRHRLMTDEELRARINRLELEKRYRSLASEDLNRGQKMIQDVLVGAGPQAFKTIASGAILYSGKVALTKKHSANEAADYLFPKPKKK